MNDAPESSAPREEILDMATLEELLNLDDGATGLVMEMAGLFQEDGPLRITQLKEACAAGDHQAAGESAHALKGAAGTLGAVRLRALAGEAERLARQNDLPAIQRLIPSLEASYPVFMEALQAFIREKS